MPGFNILSQRYGASNYTPEELAGDDWETFNQGITQTGALLTAWGAQMARRMGLDPAAADLDLWNYDLRKEAEEGFEQLSPERRAAINKPLGSGSDLVAQLWSKGLSSLPSVLASAGATVGGTVLGGPVGGAAGLSLSGAALTGGEGINTVVSAIEQEVDRIPGLSLQQKRDMQLELRQQAFSTGADIWGTAAGAVTGLIGPESALLSPVREAISSVGKSFLGRTAVAVAGSALGETAEGTIPPLMVNEAAANLPEGMLPEQDVWSQAFEEGVIGGLMGLPGGVVSKPYEVVQPGHVDTAEQAALEGEPLGEEAETEEESTSLDEDEQPPQPTQGAPVPTDVAPSPDQLVPPTMTPEEVDASVEAYGQNIIRQGVEPDSPEFLKAVEDYRNSLLTQLEEEAAGGAVTPEELAVPIEGTPPADTVVALPVEEAIPTTEPTEPITVPVDDVVTPEELAVPIEGTPPTDVVVAAPPVNITPELNLPEEAIPTVPEAVVPPVEAPPVTEGAPLARSDEPGATTPTPEIVVSERPPDELSPEAAAIRERIVTAAAAQEQEQQPVPEPLPRRQRREPTVTERYTPSPGATAAVSQEPLVYSEGHPLEGQPVEREGRRVLPSAVTPTEYEAEAEVEAEGGAREPGEQRMLEYRQSVKTPAAVRDASGNVYTGWSHEDALASMPSAALAGEVEFGFLPPTGRFVGVWEAEDRRLAGVFPKGPSSQRNDIYKKYPQFKGRTDLSVANIVKKIEQDPIAAQELIQNNTPEEDDYTDVDKLATRLEDTVAKAEAEGIIIPKGVTKNTDNHLMWLQDMRRTAQALRENPDNRDAQMRFALNEMDARIDNFKTMRGTFGSGGVGRGAGVGGGVEALGTDIEGEVIGGVQKASQRPVTVLRPTEAKEGRRIEVTEEEKKRIMERVLPAAQEHAAARPRKAAAAVATSQARTSAKATKKPANKTETKAKPVEKKETVGEKLARKQKEPVKAQPAKRRTSDEGPPAPVDQAAIDRQQENNRTLAHGEGSVKFFGNWVKPKEKLTLGDAARRFNLDEESGTEHGNLVRKILQVLVKTRGDVPVYILANEDMSTARGHQPRNEDDTSGFFSHPDLENSPHEATGFIGIREDQFNNRNILAHEGIHPLTHDLLNMFPEMEQQLQRVLDQIKADRPVYPTGARGVPIGSTYYGLTNVREMLAEITDPQFAELLHSVPIDRDVAKRLGLEGWRKATLWNGIVASVRKYFNKLLEMMDLKPVTDFNAFDAVLSTIERAAQTYDPQALSEYQSRGLRKGAFSDEDFLSMESDLRSARIRVGALGLNRSARGFKIKRAPTSDAKVINDEVSAKATFETARAFANRATSSNVSDMVQEFFMRARSRDSIMRAYEHLFPDGMLRRAVNALSKRETLAQQLNADDAKLMQEQMRLFAKYKDQNINKQSVQDVYENSLHDQSNWQVDASIPLDKNTWLYDKKGNITLEGKVSSSKYNALSKEFNSLPADLQALMKRQFKWTRSKLQRIMDGVLTNTVLNATEGKGLTPARALALGRRVVEGTDTSADVDMIGQGAANDIRSTPEFNTLKGPYSPFMRFGKWEVRAQTDVKDPTSGKFYKEKSLQSYIVNFYGSDAEAQATKFATASRDEHTKLFKVWTDAKGHSQDAQGNVYTSKDVVNGAVESYRVTIQNRHVEFFESQNEANDAAAALKADKYYKSVELGEKIDTSETYQQATASSRGLQSILNELKDRDALAGLPPKIRQEAMAAIQQAVFRAAPGTSISKRRMQRKHVAGASKDSLRVMDAYARSTNNYIAGIETAHEIHESFKDLQTHAGTDYSSENSARKVFNELSKRRNQHGGAYDRSRPIVDFLTGWQFVDKLASPAYSIINMTQTPMITIPKLAEKHGLFNSARAVNKAWADIGFIGIIKSGFKESNKALWGRLDSAVSYHDFVTKNNPKVTGNRVKMLDKLVEYGSLDPDAGFEALKARSSNKAQNLLKYVEDIFRQFPRAVEASNRYGSALAAYDLAMKKPGTTHETAVEYARDIVDSTQFNYSAGNTSPYFNTAIGRVALQFMKFGASMYQLLGSQVHRAFNSKSSKAERLEAIKGLSYLIGAHVIMSGFGGLPLEPARGLVIALNLAGVDVEWSDVENYVREVAAEMVGTEAAEVMVKGLPRALGFDVSNRINFSNLLVPEPQADFDERGGTGAYFWQIAGGATGGNIEEIFEGFNHLQDGEYMQAVEKIIPIKMLTDISTAVRVGTVGKKTSARDVLMHYTPWEMFTRSLGIRPSSEAELSEARNTIYRRMESQNEARADILRDYFEAPVGERYKFGPRFRDYNVGKPYDQQINFSTANQFLREKNKKATTYKKGVPVKGNEQIIEDVLRTYGP